MSEKIAQILENLKSKNICILGPGGVGKTTFLLACYKELLLSYDKNKMIPIFVPIVDCDSDEFSIRRYFAAYYLGHKKFDDEKSLYQEMEKTLFNDTESDIKYVFILDGVNEKYSEEIYNSEIIYLSQKSNIRIIYSTRSTSNSLIKYLDESWSIFKSEGVSKQVIEKYIETEDIDSNLLEILSLPFFLSKFIHLNKSVARSKYSNKYRLLKEYIDDCVTKEIVKLKNSSISFENNNYTYEDMFDYVVNDWLPDLCIYMSNNKQGIVFNKTDNCKPDYLNISLLTKKFLMPLGLIRKASSDKGRYAFSHEMYYDFFLVSGIYNKLSNDPSQLTNFKSTENIRLFIDMFNDNEELLTYLNKVNEAISASEELRKDKTVNMLMVKLYSAATSTLDGVDFSCRDLSLASFSDLTRITNCNFRESTLSSITFNFPDDGIHTTSKHRKLIPLISNPSIFLCDCSDQIIILDLNNNRLVDGAIRLDSVSLWCTSFFNESEHLITLQTSSNSINVARIPSMTQVNEFELPAKLKNRTIKKIISNNHFILLIYENSYFAEHHHTVLDIAFGERSECFDMFCFDALSGTLLYEDENIRFADIFSNKIWYIQEQYVLTVNLSGEKYPTDILTFSCDFEDIMAQPRTAFWYDKDGVYDRPRTSADTFHCIGELEHNGFYCVRGREFFINDTPSPLSLNRTEYEEIIFTKANAEKNKLLICIRNNILFKHKLIVFDTRTKKAKDIPYFYSFPFKEKFVFVKNNLYIVNSNSIYDTNSNKTIFINFPCKDEIIDCHISDNNALLVCLKNIYVYNLETYTLVKSSPIHRPVFSRAYASNLSLITQLTSYDGQSDNARSTYLGLENEDVFRIELMCKSKDFSIISNFEERKLHLSVNLGSECDEIFVTYTPNDFMFSKNIGKPRDIFDAKKYDDYLDTSETIGTQKIYTYKRNDYYKITNAIKIDRFHLLLEYSRPKGYSIIRKVNEKSSSDTSYMSYSSFVIADTRSNKNFFLIEGAPFFLMYNGNRVPILWEDEIKPNQKYSMPLLKNKKQFGEIRLLAKMGLIKKFDILQSICVPGLRTKDEYSYEEIKAIMHRFPGILQKTPLYRLCNTLSFFNHNLSEYNRIDLPTNNKPKKVLYKNEILFIDCVSTLLLIVNYTVKEHSLLHSFDDWYYDDEYCQLITVSDMVDHGHEDPIRKFITTIYSIDEDTLEVKSASTETVAMADNHVKFLGLFTRNNNKYYVFENGIYIQDDKGELRKIFEPFLNDVTGSSFFNVKGLTEENKKVLKMYGGIT